MQWRGTVSDGMRRPDFLRRRRVRCAPVESAMSLSVSLLTAIAQSIESLSRRTRSGHARLSALPISTKEKCHTALPTPLTYVRLARPMGWPESSLDGAPLAYASEIQSVHIRLKSAHAEPDEV